jgi:hypothetical protein
MSIWIRNLWINRQRFWSARNEGCLRIWLICASCKLRSVDYLCISGGCCKLEVTVLPYYLFAFLIASIVTSKLQVGHFWLTLYCSPENHFMIQWGWNRCLQVLSLLKLSPSLNLSKHITHSVIPNSSTTLSPFLNLTSGIFFSYSFISSLCIA